MRTDTPAMRLCRRASADFALLVLGCACAFAACAKDADIPVSVVAPKPEVIQPSVVTPPPTPELPPSQPETSVRAKAAKGAKGVKRQAAKSVKPAAKSKPKPKRR